MTDTTMNTHPSNLLPLEREGAGLILTPCPGTKGVPTGVALEQLSPVTVWQRVCDHLKQIIAGVGPPKSLSLLRIMQTESGNYGF